MNFLEAVIYDLIYSSLRVDSNNMYVASKYSPWKLTTFAFCPPETTLSSYVTTHKARWRMNETKNSTEVEISLPRMRNLRNNPRLRRRHLISTPRAMIMLLTAPSLHLHSTFLTGATDDTSSLKHFAVANFERENSSRIKGRTSPCAMKITNGDLRAPASFTFR